MAPLEELSFEPLGDVVLARVKGEVDLSNAQSVRERLLDAVPNTATGAGARPLRDRAISTAPGCG